MKVSMNGLRKQLSGDVQQLRDVAELIINGEHYEKSELLEAVNSVIRHSNVLNCVFEKDDPEFSDLSDIEVPLIEEDANHG